MAIQGLTASLWVDDMKKYCVFIVILMGVLLGGCSEQAVLSQEGLITVKDVKILERMYDGCSDKELHHLLEESYSQYNELIPFQEIQKNGERRIQGIAFVERVYFRDKCLTGICLATRFLNTEGVGEHCRQIYDELLKEFGEPDTSPYINDKISTHLDCFESNKSYFEEWDISKDTRIILRYMFFVNEDTEELMIQIEYKSLAE